MHSRAVHYTYIKDDIIYYQLRTKSIVSIDFRDIEVLRFLLNRIRRKEKTDCCAGKMNSEAFACFWQYSTY